MMDFPGKLTPYQARPSHDRQQRRIGDIPGDQENPNAPLEGVIVLEYFRRLHLGRYLGHFGEMKRLNPAMPWFSNKQLWSMASCCESKTRVTLLVIIWPFSIFHRRFISVSKLANCLSC